MGKYIVAKTSDVPENGRIIVEVNGHSIGVFNGDGNFHALLNRCPHQGAELCRGALVGSLRSERPGQFDYDPSRKHLTCPWHGWEFDLATGQSFWDPRRTRVRPYPVDVAPGQQVAEDLAESGDAQLTKGPYIAETIPLSIEDDYLVLTLARSR